MKQARGEDRVPEVASPALEIPPWVCWDRLLQPLPHTCAALPRAGLGPRARGADACKGANEVLAQHAAGVAVLRPICTLVHVCT